MAVPIDEHIDLIDRLADVHGGHRGCPVHTDVTNGYDVVHSLLREDIHHLLRGFDGIRDGNFIHVSVIHGIHGIWSE